MAKKAKPDYFPCEVSRPLYSGLKKINSLKVGDRFFLQGNKEHLYIRTNKLIENRIVCVSDYGIIEELDQNLLVKHVQGVAMSFKKISRLIIDDVNGDGYLLYRKDLYPD